MKNNENIRFDEYRRIDDLFRKGLTGLNPEPSRDLWKGISRKLWWDELSHFTFNNLSSIVWIGGFAGLAVIVAVIVISSIPQSAVTNGVFAQNLSGNSSSFKGEIQLANSGVVPTNALYVRKNVIEKQNREASNPFLISSLSSALAPSQIKSRPLLLSERHTPSENEDFEPVNTDLSGNIRNSEETGLSFMNPIESTDLFSSASSDTLRFVSHQTIYNVPKEKSPLVSFFSIGLGLSPEVLLNKTNNVNAEMNFYGNAEFTYHIGRFSVRSGVGLGYVFSDGIYRIDYKSKDSVGYYNTVVAFALSQENPKEIVYITQRTVVYDSLTHIADDRTRNRYTYLQVPLLAGFRVLETHHFGLLIEAGPMVSFLVGKKEAEPVINYQNARIIRIDKNTPERNKVNWQLYAGLRFDYQFTKNISLFAEPYYKYYFNPITIQNENQTSNTYSLGMGIGIQYYFGKKHQ